MGLSTIKDNPIKKYFYMSRFDFSFVYWAEYMNRKQTDIWIPEQKKKLMDSFLVLSARYPSTMPSFKLYVSKSTGRSKSTPTNYDDYEGWRSSESVGILCLL